MAFMSIFFYNIPCLTLISEDEDALIHKIHKREKGPPPHKNEDIHPEINLDENIENKPTRIDFFNKENSSKYSLKYKYNLHSDTLKYLYKNIMKLFYAISTSSTSPKVDISSFFHNSIQLGN